MKRRLASVVSASFIVCFMAVAGPARTASAAPVVPNSVSQLLAALSNQVSSLVPIGPSVFTDIDTSRNSRVFSDGNSEIVRVFGVIYNCSGLFLPVQGLDGPINLEVTVTQSFRGTVTVGHRRLSTPNCDGQDHTVSAFVPVTGGTLAAFGTGTAIVEVDMFACDVTGCNRWSSAGNVNVTL